MISQAVGNVKEFFIIIYCYSLTALLPPDRASGATGRLKICFFRGARREAPGTPEKTL